MQLLHTTGTASLLAATAALATVALADQIPRDQGVSASTFAAMVRYSTFASAGDHFPCGHAPLGTTIDAYIHEPITDTQATIFRDDATKEIILTFQGTASLADILTDVNVALADYKAGNGLRAGCNGCKVHTGFYSAWTVTAPLVKGNLTQELTKFPTYSTTIVGHSLGGALASLAFAELSAAGYKITKAYTLGQPRTGNPAYAAYVDAFSGASDTNIGTLRRLTHANDPVPLIIPTNLGYSHHRTEFWQQDGADNKTSAALTSRCYGDEPQDCSQSSTSTNPLAHSQYSNVEVSGTSPACN